jgi:hypothetical protein
VVTPAGRQDVLASHPSPGLMSSCDKERKKEKKEEEKKKKDPRET